MAYNDIVPAFRLQNALLIAAGADNAAFQAAHRIHLGLGPITGSESSGDSHYHALQVWVNRRFANRLSFQAAYTWSHTISNVPLTSFTTATTDPFNYDLDRGDADLDRRHMFVFNAVYVLPSLKQWGPIASSVLGDWQLNTIISALSGVPIDLTTNKNTAGLASGTQRPNLVPGQPLYLNGDPRFYLNPAAFAVPSPGQFGDVGRGVVRAPGLRNVDFSINKNWRVRERYGVQFRAEMFNAFNHVNLITVDNNITSGTFGHLSGDRGPREIQFGLKFTF